jgi:hypothetical protein
MGGISYNVWLCDLCARWPTCFGSSLPSSVSLLDPPELLEIQIRWVVYHIVCGYVICVPDCCGSMCCTFSVYCWSLLMCIYHMIQCDIFTAFTVQCNFITQLQWEITDNNAQR